MPPSDYDRVTGNFGRVLRCLTINLKTDSRIFIFLTWKSTLIFTFLFALKLFLMEKMPSVVGVLL